MGNSAISVFKPLYERILQTTLQIQRGGGQSADLAASFAAEQSKMLGPIFKEFDSDGNGFLDQKELALLVRKSLEAQREYLPDMMLKLTLAEAERNHADDNVKAMIRDMLRSSLAEIEKALDQMVAQSDALVPAITAGLDTNGDGKVSNDEFLSGYLAQANTALSVVSGGAQ